MSGAMTVESTLREVLARLGRAIEALEQAVRELGTGDLNSIRRADRLFSNVFVRFVSDQRPTVELQVYL